MNMVPRGVLHFSLECGSSKVNLEGFDEAVLIIPYHIRQFRKLLFPKCNRLRLARLESITQLRMDLSQTL